MRIVHSNPANQTAALVKLLDSSELIVRTAEIAALGCMCSNHGANKTAVGGVAKLLGLGTCVWPSSCTNIPTIRTG